MNRTKALRTLEELWGLEDKHPPLGSNPAGLMRWMYATGMINGTGRDKRPRSRRDMAARRNGSRTRR